MIINDSNQFIIYLKTFEWLGSMSYFIFETTLADHNWDVGAWDVSTQIQGSSWVLMITKHGRLADICYKAGGSKLGGGEADAGWKGRRWEIRKWMGGESKSVTNTYNKSEPNIQG